LYACVYRPPGAEAAAPPSGTVVEIAEQFSPRYERHGDDLVSMDISGLERLLGPARTIGEEMRREALARGARAQVGVAGTRMAALVLALARPGLTVVPAGAEAEALAPLPIAFLDKAVSSLNAPLSRLSVESSASSVDRFKRWGLRTLGDLAALPAADLVARLGRPALAWQAIARGEDIRPLVPTLPEERFESSLELEWPIDDLEPLSFVLTRLLEPLSTRLERRDRGAAVLHVLLRLVTREVSARRLELPSPMRDVRTLRTLALLELESHPPDAAIDRVTIVIDPTPGRVLQHTLFTRAHPTPEQLSTLVARLGALMGHDRFGAAATVDSHRPGAFVLTAFATEHDDRRSLRADRAPASPADARESGHRAEEGAGGTVVSALRRCRQPVAARVAIADGRPVRVTTDRRGFAGGTVTACAGPWRTSGEWWLARSGGTGRSSESRESDRPAEAGRENAVRSTRPASRTPPTSWNRDEWDVALSDGAVYRMFQDRESDAWFIDAIVD
jgi:protein ImuB